MLIKLYCTVILSLNLQGSMLFPIDNFVGVTIKINYDD